jgi:hypothetical protein
MDLLSELGLKTDFMTVMNGKKPGMRLWLRVVAGVYAAVHLAKMER